jgi:hypothetical protein
MPTNDLASLMKDRIDLQQYAEGADNVGHAYVPLVFDIPASTEPQGGGQYRFRIRYRTDLRDRDDLEPAMRVIYRGTTLVVDDIFESQRRVEVTILAHREIVEEIDHLATGTRRIKSWPQA